MPNNRVLNALIVLVCFSLPATAEMTSCKLAYGLKGWSIFYKNYTGSGRVTCQNGQSVDVDIVAKGGGLTIGKSVVDHGIGAFSEVKSIREIFGTYLAISGHAGATKSVEGWAMTKGEVSLALSGQGRGFDLGFSVGGFTILKK